MKKNLLPFKILLLLVCVGATHFVSAQANYITIPDLNFRAELKVLYPGCFNGADQLNTNCSEVASARYLTLNGKEISDLTGIEYFTSLENLMLDNNALTSLPPLPATLEYLYLNFNNFTSLPILPTGLRLLSMWGNQLTVLPSLPTSLGYLDVGNNQLTTLPSLPLSLENLHIVNNQLITLPSLPSGLTNLSANQNQLTSIPTIPSTLQILSVEGNQLTSLPDLQNVNTVRASGNQLISLPTLPSGLIRLSVDNNQLTSLPNLPNSLLHLSAQYNPLNSLPNFPPNLITIYISGNGNVVTTLPDLPTGLTELSLNNLGLTSLPALPNSITMLGLSNNQLTSLPALPSSLKSLGIPFNKFSSLPPLPTSVTLLYAFGNYLDFADIEAITPKPAQFFANPQAYDITPSSQIVIIGNTLSITGGIGGASNLYQWKKDGVNIAGATNPTLVVENATLLDAGIYECEVTSSDPANSGITIRGSAVNVTVRPPDQFITFDPLPVKTYGDLSFNLTATSTSGLTVSFTSSNTSVATITGNVVTIVGAGNAVITASQPGNEDYYQAVDVVQTLTVSKVVLTASADAKTKVYGDANPVLTFVYTGFKGIDNASVLDTSPSISTTAIVTSNVGSYPITLAGGTDNNYTLALVNNTLTVNKAMLTATADAKTKVYRDANPTLTITYTGFKGIDNSSVIDTPPSISTTAITTSNVGTYPITLTGGSDNNYALTLVNNTLTVNKATLTVTAEAKAKIYGDANPTLTFTYSGFKGLDNPGVLDTPPSISTTAITTSNVGTYPITLAGGMDDNYALTLINGTLTINKAILTATVDAKTKIYGDANPALTFVYTGFKGIDNASVIDTPPSVSTTAITTSNVGAYPITLAGGTDDNYTLALVNGTLTINKATLTATADTKTKIYGDTNPALTFVYTGFKGIDNAGVIDTPPSISTTAITTSNVGTYPITLTGGADNNYDMILVGNTLTINKAPLTATAEAKTKIYGDANPVLTLVYSGFKGLDNPGVIDTPPSISTSAVTTSNVGVYPITLAGGMDDNYALTLVNGSLTVNKAILTATADAKTKTYGDVNPVLTIIYTGFKGIDNASVIDTPPSISSTAITTSNAGSYPITLTGGTDNNYTLTLVNSTLTINKATLTATADAKTKIYGDANPTLTFIYSGFKGLDNPSVIDTPPSISTTAITTSNVGTYPITLAGGTDNNYILTLVNSTLTINKATLTATADAKTKVYGDANPALTFVYTGFKGADNASVIDTPPSISTTAITTSNVGSYPITLSGGVDNNYTLAFVNNTITINKAPLTATADAKIKIYGDVNPALTIIYTGFKGVDNASVIDTPPSTSTTAITTSNVGSYPITLTGGIDNNYTLTLVNSTLTINKATLTATADAKTKTYGDVNPALTITYTGFKGADNASVIDTSPSISTTAITTSNVGSYPITLAGGTDNNYALSLVNGSMSVIKAILTVTADAKSKVYATLNPALTFTYAGFIGSEDASVLDAQPSISTTAILTSDAGTYPITLTGGFDNNYSFTFINSLLTIYRGEQTLLFGPLADRTIGDGPFILLAIGGPSGNPVTFTSSNSAVAIVFGNVVTIVGSGSTIITASQIGNTNYNAATPVTQSLTVNAANQTIIFNALPAKNFGDVSFNPGATASSGLTVSYTSSDPTVASIIGNMISIVGTGTTTIIARQLGNANYAAATDVAQTLTVNPSPLVVTPSSSTICFGTSATLVATGAATYTWSPSTGLSSSSGSSVVARPSVTTTYTITATYPNGVTESSTTTIKVNAMPLAGGGNHSVIKYCGSCGGYVTTSGQNTSGQLGNGTTTQSTNPVTLPLSGIEAVAAGTSHSLFLKSDGTVWASGLNSSGQLGDGTFTNRLSPVQVVGLTGIVGISAGNTHSLFLKDDGTVWACGLNSDGQLGDGTLTQRNIAIQVIGLSEVIKISAGGLHSLFLKNDGTVWATGRNANGQLGDGTTIGKTSVINIPSLSGITEIAAGGNHSHFLKSNGTVWATGLNSNGQLGNGTTASRNTPSALATINFVTSISGGTSHTLFLRNDGTAWSAGQNSNGQLGDGTTTQSSAPLLVGLLNVRAIDAGATHSLFLTDDGSVWAAGRNANGQLGDGTTAMRTLPVQTVNVSPCGRSATKDDSVEPIAETHFEPLQVYPNPANNELTIDLPQGASNQIIPIQVFDNYGKLIAHDSFNAGEASKTISTNNLPSGLYILRVETANGFFSKKITIIH